MRYESLDLSAKLLPVICLRAFNSQRPNPQWFLRLLGLVGQHAISGAEWPIAPCGGIYACAFNFTVSYNRLFGNPLIDARLSKRFTCEQDNGMDEVFNHDFQKAK
jgi:hypothetical protein